MTQPTLGGSDVLSLLDNEEKKVRERAAREALEKEQKTSNTTANRGSESRSAPRHGSASADAESDSRPHDRGRLTDGSERRSDKYASERDENNERRSRRSKDLADDDTKHGSDENSANGDVKRLHTKQSARSRSPGRGSYYRSSHSTYQKDSYRPGQSSNDDRDRSYRTRSPGRLDRPLEDDFRRGSARGRGGRDRSQDRDHHRRNDHRDRERSGDDRRSGRKKTPEASTDERDKRTVFVQQLAARLRTRQLEDFFSAVGKVLEAQIVKDRVSGRSKGVGYVEFEDEASVKKAMDLTGQQLMGIPIIVQLTEAEKNRQVRVTENGATQSNGAPFHRLYVGNIHFSVTEADLKAVFQPFGELEFVQLQVEEGGRSKGYGFVQFTDPTQAKEALEHMNGFEIAGRPIRVGLGNDRFTTESTKNLLGQFQANAANQQGSSFSGMGGRGTHAGGSSNFDRPGGRDSEKYSGASALDDSDVSGVQFSNVDRFSLMNKLARREDPTAKTQTKAQVKKPIIEYPPPTRCVVLKNVYDQNKETNPDWQEEIQGEIKSECEAKFGKVLHIALGLDSDEGEVYVKFETVKAGEEAIKSLNGRWFAGSIITAGYLVDAIYNMKWPKSANL